MNYRILGRPLTLARRMPLVVWTLVAGVLVGGLIWQTLDLVQGARIRAVAEKEFVNRLRQAASVDRQRYDESMRGHTSLVRVLADQGSVLAKLVDQTAWTQPTDDSPVQADILDPGEFPTWLATRSLFRSFPIPDFILLLDASDRVRKVYRSREIPVPDALLEPTARMMLVTRGQSVLKKLDEHPYILASWPVTNGAGK